MTDDVIVIGAGVIGLTSAIAFAENGWRVTVIDRGTPPIAPTADKDSDFDVRTYSLTPASMRVFENLSIWQYVDTKRVAPIEDMQVWDARSSGSLNFDPFAVGQVSLGVIIEHKILVAALHRRLQDLSNIDIHSDIAEGINPFGDMATVATAKSELRSAGLVICADGGRSATRTLLGINVDEVSYEQTALVCNVKTSQSHSNTARQIFRDEGPLAFLPLTISNLSSIVWTTSDEQANELLTCAVSEFEHSLRSAFDDRLGDCKLVSERQAFPLRRLHAENYVLGHAVLVGDAAHVIHPLAGQGLNLGIMDAAALNEVCRLDGDHIMPTIGARRASFQVSEKSLRQYERWRRHENQLMISATERLNQLFRQTDMVSPRIRGWGMGLVDRVQPMKRMFMRHAMGIADDGISRVPTLAKPDTALRDLQN